jgi:hypothetical protein
MAITAHRRQFVIGPAFVAVEPDWERHDLAPGLVLSRSPALPIAELRTGDGQNCLLLGLAVSAEADLQQASPAQTITDLARISSFWAGKWALISAERCWNDAMGILGLYYREVDGVTWLGSSPAVLGKYLPAPLAPLIPWDVLHRRGMDWIPAPLTSREGIFRLMPQRFIEPLTGKIHVLPGLPQDGPTAAVTLVQTMRNWGAVSNGSERLVTLTGGLDSRTVLAAAVAAGVDCIALTGVADRTAWADRKLPPKLARTAGVRHRWQRNDQQDVAERQRRLTIAAEQMDGLFIHPVWESFASARMDQRHDRGGLASGHTFEVCRCYYWRKLIEPAQLPVDDLLAAFFKGFRPKPYDRWRQALEIWQSSLADEVPLQMDWRCRFYLDQRGAWLSQVRRAADLSPELDFYPANSLWFMKRMFEVPAEERIGGKLQLSLIGEMAPALAAYPVNPLPPMRRILRFVKKVASAIDDPLGRHP